MQQFGRYRFQNIEHTADKAIIAYGETYEQMLESAAAGMFSQQVDLSTVPQERIWTITTEAESAEDLLIAWLRELLLLSEDKDVALLLSEDKDVALADFSIIEFQEWKLKAEVRGGGYTDSIYRTGAAVKAVTYHRLSVTHNTEWQGEVTFDV